MNVLELIFSTQYNILLRFISKVKTELRIKIQYHDSTDQILILKIIQRIVYEYKILSCKFPFILPHFFKLQQNRDDFFNFLLINITKIIVIN